MMSNIVVGSANDAGLTGLKAKAQSYGRFLLRWGWFVVFSMILTTICSCYIPDIATPDSYQASYQVQITSAGAGGSVNATQATSFFAGLLQSSGVLNLALSKLHTYQQFKDLQLSDLQGGLVMASVVKGSNFVSLSAHSDSPQNASIIVVTIYQTLIDKIRTDRNNVIDNINTSLNEELKAVEGDAANTFATLQQLQATRQTDTHQYSDLSNLYTVQRDRIRAIIASQVSLQQQGYDNLVRVMNNSPVVTTVPGGGATRSDRLTLSPLVGFIMGLGGALAASRFSSRLPLRGKKRELILPHILTVVPALQQLKEDRLSVLTQSAASHCMPLLRRLRYQASEHEKRMQMITVTSPRQHEGKSTIATSMAIAAAQSGLNTILVDANPRRPVIDQYFQLPKTQGTLDTIQSLAMGSIVSNTGEISPSGSPGRPQGIAPTVATNRPPKDLRTIVGAIPCGRPGEPEAYFTRIVPCGRPRGPDGLISPVLPIVLETSIPKLSVLPIGVQVEQEESSPLYEPLRIDGLRPLSELLRTQAEIIIFDGPSLLHDTNLANLAALSDAVVLVVDAQKSQSDSVLEAEALLTEMGIFFTVLLNRTATELVG